MELLDLHTPFQGKAPGFRTACIRTWKGPRSWRSWSAARSSRGAIIILTVDFAAGFGELSRPLHFVHRAFARRSRAGARRPRRRSARQPAADPELPGEVRGARLDALGPRAKPFQLSRHRQALHRHAAQGDPDLVFQAAAFEIITKGVEDHRGAAGSLSGIRADADQSDLSLRRHRLRGWAASQSLGAGFVRARHERLETRMWFYFWRAGTSTRGSRRFILARSA